VNGDNPLAVRWVSELALEFARPSSATWSSTFSATAGSATMKPMIRLYAADDVCGHHHAPECGTLFEKKLVSEGVITQDGGGRARQGNGKSDTRRRLAIVKAAEKDQTINSFSAPPRSRKRPTPTTRSRPVSRRRTSRRS